MAEMIVPNLGHTPDKDARRDAVHIAVAPVVAGHKLNPSSHVAIRDGVAYQTGLCEEYIGIVDPFLTFPVENGQQFWLFLYPGSVTSLRHVWSHPAFKPKVPTVEVQDE